MPLVGPRFPHARLQRPQTVFAPAAPTQQQQTILTARDAAARHRRATEIRRFAKQWYEPDETRVGTGSGIIVYAERAIGPDPPQFIRDAFVAPPLSVNQVLIDRLGRRKRRQLPGTFLSPPILPSGQVFFGPQVYQVLIDRLGRRKRRQLPGSFLSPPTVLQTFEGPQTTLVSVRTRADRQRRRLPDSFLLPPATLEPETVALAEREIRTVLVRTRPRHTLGTQLGPLIFYPQASEILVVQVRARPRATRSLLPLVIVSTAAQTFAAQIAPLVRTRPRRTQSFLFPPTVLQTFGGPQVTLTAVQSRLGWTRRKTEEGFRAARSRAEVLEGATSIAPHGQLYRLIGPRPPITMFPVPTRDQLTIKGVQVSIRPPHTVAVLTAPTLEPESVALAERQIRVALVRIHPRPTATRYVAPVTYAQTSEIGVTLARTRPRATRHSLGPLIFYAATSEIQVAVIRIRPRPTTWRLSVPISAAAQVFQGALAPTVRTRPRHVSSRHAGSPGSAQLSSPKQ